MAVPIQLARGSSVLRRGMFDFGASSLQFKTSQNGLNLGIPAQLKLTSYSFEGWGYLHRESPGGGFSSFFNFGGNLGILYKLNDKGKAIVYHGTGSAQVSKTSTRATPIDRLFHFAVTYDAASTTLIFYLNGVAESGVTQPAPTFPSSGGSVCFIGSEGSNFNVWSGWLNRVRVYSRALSAAEVQSRFTSPGIELSGIVAAYNANEGSGTTINDLSTYANNVTSTNGWVQRSPTVTRSGQAINLMPNPGFETAPAGTTPTTARNTYIDGTAGGNTTTPTYGYVLQDNDRINLAVNPNLETSTSLSSNTTGTVDGSASSTFQDTTRSMFGTKSVRMQKSATMQWYLRSNAFTPVVGKIYTVSAYVWPENATSINFGFRNQSTFANLKYPSHTLVPGQWNRLSVTLDANSGNTANPWSIDAADPNVAGNWWIDGILIEESPVLLPYFDGSTAGAVWTGTANASTSLLSEGSGVSALFDTSVKRSGSVSLKISTTDTTSIAAVSHVLGIKAKYELLYQNERSQLIHAKRYASYRHLVYAQSNNLASNAGYVEVHEFDQFLNFLAKHTSNKLSGTVTNWTPLETTFVSSATCAYLLVVFNIGVAGNISSMWLDDQEMLFDRGTAEL